MNADWAAETLLPVQMLAMADWTLLASDPHTALRSPGLCSVLTAARRHAGGVAAMTLEERARRERRIVDFMMAKV